MKPLSLRTTPRSLVALCRRSAVLLPALAALVGAADSLEAAASGPVQFNRDIRPIFADKCLACHGFDAKKRKGNLRLDTREGATSANEDGLRAIVPGDLGKSEAWQRILSTDKDEMMPPPEKHKELTPAERETVKRWIMEGATYQKHWAFEAPQKAPLPGGKDDRWSRNAIDRFVLAKLEEEKLAPAPEADRRTLARRVSLDLTGLPPMPEEVETFVHDDAPNAYEKLVAKLMSTPQWGEHRARYWLDAARYADTHGIHFDNYREIWPYREWVIAAFNENKRFDTFTVEQLAGDLLPNPTRAQLIATGFHRCNSTTNEGGTIDEENLALYANDRVVTTSWVWLGLTANCAACHDHKFDPVTMKDFYSMAAYFRNTTQPPKDGNVKDTKPVLYLPQSADEKRFAEVAAEIAGVQAGQQQRRGAAGGEFEKWLATARPDDLEIRPEKLVVHLPLNEGWGVAVKGASADGAVEFKSEGPIEWVKGGQLGSAPAFANGNHFALGDLAGFEKEQAFSVACWMNVPAESREATLVGRMAGNQGWELFASGTKFGVQMASANPKSAVRVLTRNNTVRAGKWQHVLATYDGSGRASGFHLYLDGREQPIQDQGKEVTGPVRAAAALTIGQREKGNAFNGGAVQDVRVYARELNSGEARSLPEEAALRSGLGAEPAKRTPAQKNALLGFYLDNIDEPYRALNVKLDDLEDEDLGIKDRATVSLIQEDRKGSEPMANILARGAYDKPGDLVRPATFAVLHPQRPDAPKNRLGLAQWVVAPENPLTARVTVNRFWQEIFGTGLVRTSEDFGSQGEPPVNQALLDWLAVEFRDSGWDVKKLFTLIVTSATYRQAAVTTPEKLERDPQNRLLSRGPRFRLDAEMIRDYALATSGLLVRKIGGASVRPYQPLGVWETVAMPGSNTRDYQRDNGGALYRRSLYTFWKRAAPPASMDILNAPTRESCTVRRERTNTPLQALVTLNDPQFVEAARHLAQSAWEEANGDCAQTIDRIAARVLLRPLSERERKIVAATQCDLEKEFEAKPEDAKAFLSVGEDRPDANIPPPQLASLAMIASQLLNLDEALNK